MPAIINNLQGEEIYRTRNRGNMGTTVFCAIIQGKSMDNADLRKMDLRKANIRYISPTTFNGADFDGSLISSNDMTHKLKGANLIGALLFIKGFRSPDITIEIKKPPLFLSHNGDQVVVVHDWIIIHKAASTTIDGGTIEGQQAYWDANPCAVWLHYREQIMDAIAAPWSITL